MSSGTPRTLLLMACLASAAGGCGGGEKVDASGRGGDAASGGRVYTSEVESVSQWIRESGAGDSVDLVATKNPRGEGVVVYARGSDSAGNDRTAAWMVVDSQVVPLNRESRRITPNLPAAADERTWSRIGITRPAAEEDADLREVLPPKPAPARQTAAPPPREAAAPVAEATDSTPPRVPRSIDTPDTLRVPATAQPKPAAGARPQPPRDTIVVPSATPPDTSRAPGTEPATPEPRPPGIEPETTPAPASPPPGA